MGPTHNIMIYMEFNSTNSCLNRQFETFWLNAHPSNGMPSPLDLSAVLMKPQKPGKFHNVLLLKTYL